MQQADEMAIPSTHSISQLEILQNPSDRTLVKTTSLENLAFDLDNESVEGPLLYEKVLPNMNSLIPAQKLLYKPRKLIEF